MPDVTIDKVEHSFDLEDGYCYTHRRSCSMAAAPVTRPAVCLTTPQGIAYATLCSIKGRLHLETKGLGDALLSDETLRNAARYCPEHTDIAEGYWPATAWYCPACGAKTLDMVAEIRRIAAGGTP